MSHAAARLTLLIPVAALILAGGPAFGQGIMNPHVQPQIAVGAQPFYYVWVDRTGWHVRWSTPVPVTFAGIITTNGTFNGVCPAVRGLPFGLSLLSADRASFSIAARPGIGGFDFQTTGALVTFNLGVSGVGIQVPGRIPAWLIYVGQQLIPSLRPFTLSVTPAFVTQNCREPLISDVDRPIKDPNR